MFTVLLALSPRNGANVEPVPISPAQAKNSRNPLPKIRRVTFHNSTSPHDLATCLADNETLGEYEAARLLAAGKIPDGAWLVVRPLREQSSPLTYRAENGLLNPYGKQQLHVRVTPGDCLVLIG